MIIHCFQQDSLGQVIFVKQYAVSKDGPMQRSPPNCAVGLLHSRIYVLIFVRKLENVDLEKKI